MSVPLHDVEGQLDQLCTCELSPELVDQGSVDVAGLRHHRVSETQRSLLPRRERTSVGRVDLRDSCLVETFVPGNCQADRESSAAVVIASAAHSYQLGRHRLYRVESHDRRGELSERPAQCGSSCDAGWDTSCASHHVDSSKSRSQINRSR